MPFDSSEQEPVENTPIPATLTFPDGRVVPMPAALSADQVEALAYMACLFVEPLKAAAAGKTLGTFMRRAMVELARQEMARHQGGAQPPDASSEG